MMLRDPWSRVTKTRDPPGADVHGSFSRHHLLLGRLTATVDRL